MAAAERPVAPNSRPSSPWLPIASSSGRFTRPSTPCSARGTSSATATSRTCRTYARCSSVSAKAGMALLRTRLIALLQARRDRERA